MGFPDENGARGRGRRVTAAARSIAILAPAKLNLGLEVIGRRADGFHEVATIFLAIDLYDEVRLSPHREIALTCDEPSLTGATNLAVQAANALRDAFGVRRGARIELLKRIPVASGLGGASSDAAAALVAARSLWRLRSSDASLRQLALGLGSDVPFFLEGGCALGRGRGEILTSLPPPQDIRFVIVAPRVSIAKKTATLYRALRDDEFSRGERVAAQAERLAAGRPLDARLLPNPFTRPLYALAPSLARLTDAMRRAGAEVVAMSGAGPAHYAPIFDPDPGRAEALAARMRAEFSGHADVFVAAPAKERSLPPDSL